MENNVIVHAQTPFTEPPAKSLLPIIAAFLIVILAGIGTGFLLSRNKKTDAKVDTSKSASMVKSDTEAGTKDQKTFKDLATGELKLGGHTGGEGTHKLIRPGGDSQTVYLISSLVDLSQFEDKQVEVYGQTVRAKSAGWLMDVGYIKIIQ